MPFIIAIVAIVVIAGITGFVSMRDTSETVEPEVAVVEETSVVSEIVEPEVEAVPTADTTDSLYTDGAYTAATTYFTPKNVEHELTIELTIENDVVIDVATLYDNGEAGTPSHLRFDDAYEAEVAGVALADIDLSRVGGASLTSDAFNEAVSDIKVQAQG